MKITDDEREAAYELKWMIEGILFERERAVLYAQVYVEILKRGAIAITAAETAKYAIDEMERAFAPVCEHCKDEDRAAQQQKAN